MIAEATVFGQINQSLCNYSGSVLRGPPVQMPVILLSLLQVRWILISCKKGEKKKKKSPFLIGQKHPCDSSNNAWKDANHNNGAIEPQLSLCYEDFKDRHLFLPDIHNKGINEKEKCKDSIKKRKNKTTWRKSGHFFCTACFCRFLQNGLWSLTCYFLIQTLAFTVVFSQFVCRLKMAVYGLLLLAMKPVA